MRNLYQISASRIALERANTVAVRAYAQDMINAHTATTAALKGALPPATVGLLPNELECEHQRLIRQLRDAEGAAFDGVYLKLQRDAHDNASELLGTYAQAGSDARLKQFAQDTLPLIETHAHEVASPSASGKFAQKARANAQD
jgi:putative membrane protein